MGVPLNRQIAAARLANQRLAQPRAAKPEEVVAWFGAVQAQEYPWAKWAVALRTPRQATSAAIERAVNDGRILRTHVLRPTWHFVTGADLPWMLELTAPRVQQALSFAYRYYELDRALRTKATTAIERAFRAAPDLTRAELGAALARAGIVLKGVRLALVTVHAEVERVICSGPQRGRNATYALLCHRVPRPRRLSGDEALAELTRRYFRSHGPATLRDFVWWAGLLAADARRGLDIARATAEPIDGRTYWTVGQRRARDTGRATAHLLPTYDEYFVAYRDVDAVPRPKGALQPAIVVDGQAAGTWRIPRGGATIKVEMFRRLTGSERQALDGAVDRYGRFLETPISVERSYA